VGDVSYPGGRSGEPASTGLSEALTRAGIKLSRFKTGTPPRIDLRSVNLNLVEAQPGDEPPQGFSFYRDVTLKNSVSCLITRTTAAPTRLSVTTSSVPHFTAVSSKE